MTAVRLPTTAITRRHVLQLLGIGLTGSALASACSRSESAGETSREFHAAYPYSPPPKGNYNYLGGVSDQISMGYLGDLLFVPGALYLWDEHRYFYLLADESSALSEDGTTFTYRVRDGLSWSDGKPVTGKDIYATWLLRATLVHSVFEYVDKFELTDEMTVTFHIPTPSPIAEYYLLRERPVSQHVYAKWADRAEPLIKAGKGSDDAEVAAIAEELGKFAPDEAIVSGPFNIEYDSVSNSQLTMVRNDKGYLADKIDFERITVYNGETVTITPIVLQKEIDYATHGFPPSTERSMISADYRIMRGSTYGGGALYFCYQNCPEFADKRARQALAYAVDRKQSATVSQGKSAIAVELMTGMTDRQAMHWLPPADQEKLQRYQRDLDKAEQLLTDAGWSRDGDSWRTPEGKRAKYTIITPDHFNYVATAQNLESQLGDFGIDITVRSLDPTQATEDMQQSRFDLAINGWGATTNPFPSAAFDVLLFDFNYVGLTDQRGMDFPMQQTTDVVGDIDLEQAVIDAGLGANEDALVANVTRTALAINELLPVVPMWERLANSPALDSRITGWPAEDDALYNNSPYADNFTTILMYQGKLKVAESS